MFAPLAPHIDFTPVEPRYARVKFIATSIGFIPLILAAIIVDIFIAKDRVWLWAIPAVVLVMYVWTLALISRRVRALGYAELEDELVLCRGIMFQRVDVIPYGRMQQVNVSAGPLMSRENLATVELITASAQTNGSIPGIRKEEAERLRVKLTHLGTANLEGL
ncbi:PH domain-containing protein [Arcanobacterium haemolyticum]|nr:PH domain-containing protein [Arcanobacterium haemolyticum]